MKYSQMLGGGGGSTPPTLLSATIDVVGAVLTLVFNVAVAGVEDDGFTLVTDDLEEIDATYSSGDGTATVTYTLERQIYLGEVLTLDYEVPPGTIESPSGGFLAAFTDFPVTNNSTEPEPPEATKLIFSVQPDGGVTGEDFTQQPEVRAVDDANALDTTFTGTVTLAIYSGNGTLSGTLTAAAVGGIVFFDDIRITQAAGGHNVLKASATGLTDGRSGMMTIVPPATAAKIELTFGANATDKVDCGSGASLDNLSAGNFTVMFRARQTTAGDNVVLAGKLAGGTGGWYIQMSTASATERINAAIDFDTGNAYSLVNSSNASTLNTRYDYAVRYRSSDKKIRIDKATMGAALAEVSGYDTQAPGIGSPVSDAAAKLYIGNVELADLPFFGGIEALAIFSAELTSAQLLAAQFAFDRDNQAALAAISGYVDSWRLNQTGTITSGTGSNNGTVTGATTSSGQTVIVPSVWGGSLDATNGTTHLVPSQNAWLSITTSATSAIIGVRRSTELDASRDAQAAISLENTNAYEAQSLATTANTLQYLTRSIAAGSDKPLRFVNSVSTRTGSPGTGTIALGVGVVTLRLNDTFTETIPPTPATSYLVFHDSLFGFSQDPVGEYAPQERLRRYLFDLPGSPQLYCAGFGGQSLWHLANDAAARTATVNVAKKFSPTRITLFLGGNDYGSSLWTAADFAIGLAALLVALNAEFPNAIIDVITVCTFTSEGANGLGDDLDDYRTAVSTATSGKAYANPVSGPASISGGANLAPDGVHRTNAGGEEIYDGFLTMWEI